MSVVQVPRAASVGTPSPNTGNFDCSSHLELKIVNKDNKLNALSESGDFERRIQASAGRASEDDYVEL